MGFYVGRQSTAGGDKSGKERGFTNVCSSTLKQVSLIFFTCAPIGLFKTDFHGVTFGKLRTCLSQHALAPIMTPGSPQMEISRTVETILLSLTLFFLLSLEQNSPT